MITNERRTKELSELYQSLSHSKWDCKYHIVFVPYCVRAQAAAKSDLRADAPSSGANFPCSGPAKGVPDCRGTPDAGPCAHVHRNSTQAPGCICDWVSQREERDRHRPPMRKGAQFCGRAFLGS